MKIYTSVEWQWNDKLGKLVEINSESFDYSGDLAECKSRYSYSENHQETFYDEEGNSFKVFRRKWRSHKNRGSTKWRDYVIRKYDPSGNEVAYQGGTASKSGYHNSSSSVEGLKATAQQKSTGNVLYTAEEMQNKTLADKESKRLDLKAHEAVAQAKQSAIDTTKRQTEIAQKQTARVSGEAIRQQRDALLAQGYSPEESRMMTSQGSENVARTISDLGSQGMALQSQTMGQLAQFGAEQGWTAENLSMGIKQMQQDLMKHRAQLSNQLQMTAMQTGAQKDIAMKGMWGDVAQGLGSAIGGSGSGG